MWPIATVVWSLCVCWSLTTMSCSGMDEAVDMPFGMWNRLGPRNHVLGGGCFPPGGRDSFANCQPIVKCRKYQDSGVKQNYSEGGSSDAALRCQYCSNLFLLLLLLLLLLFVLYFLRCFFDFYLGYFCY